MHLHTYEGTWGLGMGDASRTRQGGNTIDDATVVDNLTESLEGTTVGYEDSYDEVCPYTGATSPDVVCVYSSNGYGCNHDNVLFYF